MNSKELDRLKNYNIDILSYLIGDERYYARNSQALIKEYTKDMNIAVIMAAGSGERLTKFLGIKKQYSLLYGDKEMFLYPIFKFLDYGFKRIILVCPPNEKSKIAKYQQEISKSAFSSIKDRVSFYDYDYIIKMYNAQKAVSAYSFS